MRRFAPSIVAILIALVAVAAAPAQSSRDVSGPRSHYTDGIVGQFDDFAGNLLAEPATVSAKFTVASADHPAALLITAKIASGRHTYSLTQPPGGPQPTTIKLEPSPNFRLLGNFRSQPAPVSRQEEYGPGTSIKVEEHEGQVTWYAPIELTAGVDPKALEIRGTIHMQVCQTHGTCEPVTKEFVAKEASSVGPGINLPASPQVSPSAVHGQRSQGGPKSAIAPFQPPGSAVTLKGRITPDSVRPGESAELEITATPPPTGHVYAYADRDPKHGTKPVLIAIETTAGLVPHRPTTDAQTKIENSEFFGPLKYHDSPVTWKIKLDVPKNAQPGEYPISGVMGYQACEFGGDGNSQCELPHAVRFAGALKVGDQINRESSPLTFTAGKSYREVADAATVFANYLDRQSNGGPANTLVETAEPHNTTAADTKDTHAESSQTPSIQATDHYDLKKVVLDTSVGGSLSYYIALAFVGGLILNLMPCVLPVIGLKVMTFVDQAGKSRTHALVLNLWFAAGIIFVFLLLGVLAATLGLSWGGQFGSTTFNVTIAAVVFAMALSLLGVWEVPIPGFFGSGSIHAAAVREGPLGAFLKGVVTTVLATPCTAPFMATAIAWAVTQTLATTLIVFATLGVGMSSPYILVGVYPELLRFLPKPGPWMETFKKISGFVLLATVIFILSFIETLAVVPTLFLLLGIAVACWIYSRTPHFAEIGERLKSWAIAGVVLLAFLGVSFGVLYRIAIAPSDMAWQPFSLQRLKQVAVEEGRTVLVDFSADWCLNCKFFEKTVLHTKPVEQAIARSGALTMYGDFTKYPPEIDETIRALGANGVPVIAIFPGDAPYKPIVFRGGYRRQDLIAALERATGRQLKTAGGSIVESTASAAPPN